jgi:FMN-dependent oxidoreductase (nitrilotriacetate monooxygenase family)
LAGRKIRLGAFLYPTGHHVAAWRHPEATADAGVNLAHYQALAQTAERGLFDLLFLADGVGMRGDDREAMSRTAIRYTGQFEPLTLLSALAVSTSRIGLVATASTTYNEPYHLARKFASLDHISGGRAGWNVVTSADDHEARNFGLGEQLPHAQRYRRAEEFVDVVTGLWDSWEDDAYPRDKDSGIYFDPSRLHVLNHEGDHFRVRGPLNVPRAPQGHPVVVQAGSSGPGKALAARTGEVIFTAQQTLPDAVEFYASLKAQAASFGRSAGDILIMPGIFPVVGRTRAEAEDLFAELQDLIHPAVSVSLLSALFGYDLSDYPLDGPLPDTPPSQGHQSRQQVFIDKARRENLSILQLANAVAGARGHWQVVGTAEDIVDVMQERFEAFGADGFNVMPPFFPGGLESFVDLVVPELQRRGLYRTEYEGRTLRENLGLVRPAHRAATADRRRKAI